MSTLTEGPQTSGSFHTPRELFSSGITETEKDVQHRSHISLFDQTSFALQMQRHVSGADLRVVTFDTCYASLAFCVIYYHKDCVIPGDTVETSLSPYLGVGVPCLSFSKKEEVALFPRKGYLYEQQPTKPTNVLIGVPYYASFIAFKKSTRESYLHIAAKEITNDKPFTSTQGTRAECLV